MLSIGHAHQYMRRCGKFSVPSSQTDLNTGICAGKHSIAQYLTAHAGFREVRVAADESDDLAFETIDALDAFVTAQWDGRWVTTQAWTLAELDKLLVRPFFALVSVDAPVGLRWRRFADRCGRHSRPAPGLEQFVRWDDRHQVTVACLAARAHVRLVNSGDSLAELHAALTRADVVATTSRRLRPDWDSYFMQLAALAAQRSNCMKRRVGAVLVRAWRVMATGYNGTPRGVKNCSEGGCRRCNSGDATLESCLCLHAEENALLEAGRERVGDNATLYCNTCPCLTCSVKIVQLGIGEVVYARGYSMDEQVGPDFSPPYDRSS